MDKLSYYEQAAVLSMRVRDMQYRVRKLEQSIEQDTDRLRVLRNEVSNLLLEAEQAYFNAALPTASPAV